MNYLMVIQEIEGGIFYNKKKFADHGLGSGMGAFESVKIVANFLTNITSATFNSDMKEALEANEAPSILTMNGTQNIQFGKAAIEHGFELAGQSNGLHGTPIYLYVRNAKTKKRTKK